MATITAKSVAAMLASARASMPDAAVVVGFGSESKPGLRSTVTTEDLALSAAGDYESYETTVRVAEGAFQKNPRPQDTLRIQWSEGGVSKRREYTVLTAMPDPTTGMIRMDLGRRGASIEDI